MRRWTVAALLSAVALAAASAGLPAGAAAADYDGNGYWTYVCDAAAAHGYGPPYNLALGGGDMNDGMWRIQNFNCSPGNPIVVGRVPGSGPITEYTGVSVALNMPFYASSGLYLQRMVWDGRIWGYARTEPLAVSARGGTSGINVENAQNPAYPAGIGAFQCYSGDYATARPRADGVRYINDTLIWGSQVSPPFFLASVNTQGIANGPGPDNELMTGGGTTYNPDARCVVDKQMTFDFQDRRPRVVGMYADCGDANPGIPDHYCRGETGTGAETRPTVLANLANEGGYGLKVRGVSAYIVDDRDPTVSFIHDGNGNNLARGGSAVEQDSPFADPALDPEYVRIAASDYSGIRSVDVFLDGQRLRRLSFTCDHRYKVPCPGGQDSMGNPASPGVNLNDIRIDTDVDPLADGVSHTVEVRVEDSAGRVGVARDSFQVATPIINIADCDIGAGVNPGPFGTPLVNTRGVANAGAATGCPTASTIPTGNNTPVEDRPTSTGSPVVPPPSKGAGIFTYDLAANERPAQRPADPNSCVTRSGVVGSGATGGMLNDVERNQIISVTVNLEGLIDKSKELGEMDLRTSFDLPARNNLEYRRALGC